jgi:hypothetical protein
MFADWNKVSRFRFIPRQLDRPRDLPQKLF